jgi:predicted nucleic acid-binding protein
VSGFLLDTNVISEAVKPSPNPKVEHWFKSIPEDLMYISVLTIGEIRRGIALQSNAARQARLQAWLEGDVLIVFRGRTLEVDVEIADRWGAITADARRRGTPMPVIDSLLAATALHHNLTFATRNTKDVASTGVSVVNPWES